MPETDRIRVQAVLTSKADVENWREIQAHYRENYGASISDSNILRRVLEQEASRTKSTSRRATINQTWWLVYDLWQRITGNELTVEEIKQMINDELGRDVNKT